MKHPVKVVIVAMLAGLGTGGGALWYFFAESTSTAPKTGPVASPATPAAPAIAPVAFLKHPLPAKPPALEPPAAFEKKKRYSRRHRVLDTLVFERAAF